MSENALKPSLPGNVRHGRQPNVPKSISSSYQVSRLASPTFSINPSNISSPFNYGPNAQLSVTLKDPYSRSISASGIELARDGQRHSVIEMLIHPELQRSTGRINPVRSPSAFLRPSTNAKSGYWKHATSTPLVEFNVVKSPISPFRLGQLPKEGESATVPRQNGFPGGVKNSANHYSHSSSSIETIDASEQTPVNQEAATTAPVAFDINSLNRLKLNLEYDEAVPNSGDGLRGKVRDNAQSRDGGNAQLLQHRHTLKSSRHPVSKQETLLSSRQSLPINLDLSIFGSVERPTIYLPSYIKSVSSNTSNGAVKHITPELPTLQLGPVNGVSRSFVSNSSGDHCASMVDSPGCPVSYTFSRSSKLGSELEPTSNYKHSNLVNRSGGSLMTQPPGLLAKPVAMPQLAGAEVEDASADTANLDGYDSSTSGNSNVWSDVEESAYGEGKCEDDVSEASYSATSRSAYSVDISTRAAELDPATVVSQSFYSVPEGIHPGLTKSLFSNIPPTIYFSVNKEQVEQLPWEIRKLLKWIPTSITPNVVKENVTRAGFRMTKNSKDWIGSWGKHMKTLSFRTVGAHQKVNHFPGTFQIGRKDRLFRNLSKMQSTHGKREFSFFPMTYILPNDWALLQRAFDEGGGKSKWILKPPASARGIGIKVVNKWSQIPKKKSVIVQKYLNRPLLINSCKFDLRLYVYVTSYDPLRVYIFNDGLVRFATTKYSHSSKSIGDRFMHLTNFSVNKKNSGYIPNDDESLCIGHKWSLRAFWPYLKKLSVDTDTLWQSIKDVVLKTIIASEKYVSSLVKANCKWRRSCHELFGFDILLDENLKAWVLEVNISPSLHSTAKLDRVIKGQMMKDLFNLAGFTVPFPSEVGCSVPAGKRESSMVPNMEAGRKLREAQMTPEERTKHAFYCQRHLEDQCRMTILDNLTSYDVRILTETEDEFSRRGEFDVLFPTIHTESYLKYFDAVRYNNLLLNQWLRVYHRNNQYQRGISVLNSYCDQNYHINAAPAKGPSAPSLRVSATSSSQLAMQNRLRKQKQGG